MQGVLESLGTECSDEELVGDHVDETSVDVFDGVRTQILGDPHEIADHGRHLVEAEADPSLHWAHQVDEAPAIRRTSSDRNAWTPASGSTEAIRRSRTAITNSFGLRPDTRTASAGDNSPSGSVSIRELARRRARTTFGWPMPPKRSLISRDDRPERCASTMAASRMSRVT